LPQLGVHVAWAAKKLLGHLCQRLDRQGGGTSTDGKVTLEFAECLGMCEGRRACSVNDELEGNVSPEGQRLD